MDPDTCADLLARKSSGLGCGHDPHFFLEVLLDSIFKTANETALLEVVEKALEPTTFRVIDIDLRVGPRSVLRLFIEKKADPKDRKVSIDDCATVSRLLDPVLETEPLLPRGYDLEVSSAGLDRRLRLKQDFEEALGSEVRLALTEKLQGVTANMRATLLRLENDGIVVKLDGKEVGVPLKQISQASVIWDGTLPKN